MKLPKIDINNSVHRAILSITGIVVIFSVLIAGLIVPAYRLTRYYWMSYTISLLLFWIPAFYPNYSWSDWTINRKVLAVSLITWFCFCFMPMDILLSDKAQLFLNINSRVVLITSVLMLFENNNNNGKPPRKRKQKQVTLKCNTNY